MKGFSKKYWAKRAEKYDRINWVKNEEFLDTYLNMLPEKVFKKIFRERARPGDGRSNTSSDLRSAKKQIWRDTGSMTQRLRLVIMTILDVFGMD